MDEHQEELQHLSHLLRKGFSPAALAITKEQPAALKERHQAIRIGLPKENHPEENRVALAPTAVAQLTAHGHQVMVQRGSGNYAKFSDHAYSEAGAQIVDDAPQLYKEADLIVKIAPLTEEQLEWLQPRQSLISAVHLGSLSADYLKVLIDKSITALGFEFIQTQAGTMPLIRSMSEIAGVSAIHIASNLLASTNGGKGVLMGGIVGVAPAKVTVLGAGTVGYYAVQTAQYHGATVKVLDDDVFKLRRLEELVGRKLETLVSQPAYLEKAVSEADVVIGAVFIKGAKTPRMVTEEMVATMQEGSVIVDVSIDQGGSVETSRATTHANPTFVEHGVIHYCVPNIASRVPQTASLAISNVLGPLVLRVAEHGGISRAMAAHTGIKSGIYVYRRHVTQRRLATLFGLDYMDIDLLHAVNL